MLPNEDFLECCPVIHCLGCDMNLWVTKWMGWWYLECFTFRHVNVCAQRWCAKGLIRCGVLTVYPVISFKQCLVALLPVWPLVLFLLPLTLAEMTFSIEEKLEIWIGDVHNVHKWWCVQNITRLCWFTSVPDVVRVCLGLCVSRHDLVQICTDGQTYQVWRRWMVQPEGPGLSLYHSYQ